MACRFLLYLVLKKALSDAEKTRCEMLKTPGHVI